MELNTASLSGLLPAVTYGWVPRPKNTNVKICRQWWRNLTQGFQKTIFLFPLLEIGKASEA